MGACKPLSLLLSVSIILAGRAGRVGAEEPARASVFVLAGQCPSAAEVKAELHDVLLRHSVAETAADAGAITVVVLDAGDVYHVQVGGGEPVTYHDRGRPCHERAQQVAVRVALVLESPDPIPNPPPPPPPPNATPPPAAVAAPAPVPTPPAPLPAMPPAPPSVSPPRPFFAVEAGGLVAAPPGGTSDGRRPVTGGGALRLVIDTPLPLLALTVGFGLLFPYQVTNPGAPTTTAGLYRIPVDLSLRATLRRGRLAGFAEAGFVLTAAPTDNGLAAFAIGGQATLGLRVYAFEWLAPFAALRADLSPDLVNGRTGARTLVPWLYGILGVAVRCW